MSEEGIGDDIKAFIAHYIDSVVQLELLILLYSSERDHRVTSEEIARELRIEPAWTASELGRLAARGFVSVADGPPLAYRYAPPAHIDRLVARVVEAYRQRRVSVINLIYSRPSDAIRSFADAFRLRKD